MSSDSTTCRDRIVTMGPCSRGWGLAYMLNLVGVGLGLLSESCFGVQFGVRLKSLGTELRISEALEHPHASQAAVAGKKSNSAPEW